MSARGELIRAGAPLVKNVTGFDLCRLLVGSLGTLALLAEVVLRCRPRPEVEPWWVGEGADPFALADALYRPLSVLWDGTRTWVGLAGYAADVRGPGRGGARAVASAGSTGRPPRPGRSGGRGRRGRCAALPGRARAPTGAGWPRSASGSCTAPRRRPPGCRPRPAPAPKLVGPAPGHQGALRSRRAAQPRPVGPGARRAREAHDRDRRRSASTPTSWPPACPAGCAWPTARPTGSPARRACRRGAASRPCGR